MKKFKYLIIGGGTAGTTAAEIIRQNDATGSIAIINDEPYRLYSRVMLSKHNFYSPEGEDKIWLKASDWYIKENIELLAGKSAVNLDAGKKTIRLNDGEEVEYDKLLLATGSCARKWTVPGSEKRGVFSLRALDDAKAIKEKFKTAKKAIAIGGGFISFEMCDIMRQFSVDTTLILRESYYLEPVLDKNEAAIVEKALLDGGVKILKNAEVSKVTGGDSVEGVILKDGTKIDCDMIIAGIGVVCSLDWLKIAGLQTGRGVSANEYLETSIADIWVAGDVAEFNDLILEERVQLGNWLNAQQQGRIAGLNMAGKKEPFRIVTSYSTSGLGVTICFVGDVRPGEDRLMISRETLEARSGARIIIKDGEIVGATLINRMPEFSLILKLIEIDFKVSGHEKELADPNFDLKKLIKIKIGWFTFSCCEDNTVVMTEVMNDHWEEWKRIFDFRHVRVLKSDNILDELDIAFIEGAIASEDHVDKLKEIREKSKKLVAIGACAIVGMPAGQRNYFSEEQKKEIEFLTARFAALPKVLRVSDVVKVDAEVPGCPMDPDKFLEVVNNLVKEFRK